MNNKSHNIYLYNKYIFRSSDDNDNLVQAMMPLKQLEIPNLMVIQMFVRNDLWVKFSQMFKYS